MVKDRAHVLQVCILFVFLFCLTSAGEGIVCLCSVLGQLIVAVQNRINLVKVKVWSNINIRAMFSHLVLGCIRLGVRSDAQLSCTGTRFQKCSQSGKKWF